MPIGATTGIRESKKKESMLMRKIPKRDLEVQERGGKLWHLSYGRLLSSGS